MHALFLHNATEKMSLNYLAAGHTPLCDNSLESKSIDCIFMILKLSLQNHENAIDGFSTKLWKITKNCLLGGRISYWRKEQCQSKYSCGWKLWIVGELFLYSLCNTSFAWEKSHYTLLKRGEPIVHRLITSEIAVIHR